MPMPWSRSSSALAALALLASWLGLLGSWHWLLDLLSHFRWQHLVISVLVLGWGIWLRQRWLMVLAALTFLLNAVLIGHLATQGDISRDALAGDFTLRALSLNVLASNEDTQAVLNHLLASEADVIFLLEVDDKWVAALSVLEAKYPHHLVQTRQDNFGVAFYSRMPWKQAELLWLGGAGLPSVQATLQHQGRELTVIGTHPVPPAGRVYSAWRDEQLRLLGEHVARLQTPVLVMGDLNATPWSAGMRLLTAGTLGFRSLDPPWVPTWSARSIFAIPIDHALATPPLVITRRTVGPDVGSDHRPISVSVAWGR
jgi:endonuclease/exonuclease/phosphatase (EEP) superfamily protein YafD